MPAMDVRNEERAMQVCPSSMKFDMLTNRVSDNPLVGTETLQEHIHSLVHRMRCYCLHAGFKFNHNISSTYDSTSIAFTVNNAAQTL